MARTSICGELMGGLRNASIFLVYASLIYVSLAIIFRLTRKERASEPMPVEAEVRQVVGSAPDTSSYWVYLGRFSRKLNKWTRRNFELSALPVQGQQILALTDLFEWDQLPSSRGNDWKQGMIMGLIPSAERVWVIRIQLISDGDYWALIRQQ